MNANSLAMKSDSARPLFAFCIAVATVFSAPPAGASDTYPSQAQAALAKHFGIPYCVPQCTLCHLTNKGGYRTLNSFGMNLQKETGLFALKPELVQPAFEKYFAEQPSADSDEDGQSDIQELEGFSSPAVAGARGEDQICMDIRYGCGARVAAGPPPLDQVSLLSAALTVLGLAAVRRLRR